MMQKFKTLSDAIALAEFAHRNQTDKAGLPYIDHPKRVLATVQAQGVQPYVQMAAVLHDVPEDTAFSHDILTTLGFSEAVTNLTRLLDRDYSARVHRRLGVEWGDHESFPDADTFYYDQIKANREATIIKLADIRDNLSGWRIVYLPEETQGRLKAKYAKALKILNPRPVNHGLINPNYHYDPFTLG